MRPIFLLLAGCTGPDNHLSGSLTDSYDMSFTSVRARLYSSELSVEYVADFPQEPETVVLRLTLERSRLAAGGTINLQHAGHLGRSDAYGSPLPDLEDGEAELFEFAPREGAPVSGHFSARLITPDDLTLTLHGGFAAPIEPVDL